MTTTTTIPADRIALSEHAPRAHGAMSRLQAAIELDGTLNNLVSLRASQLNGCAFCLDMHWQDARADGESEARLYSLDTWRESTLYTDTERAALGLCEAMTRLDDGHVPDTVWECAAQQFDEDSLAQLVFAIAAINTWNRLMITARAQPGHYRPGMFA
jgi:AhpD family alkylhydroperoxidase